MTCSKAIILLLFLFYYYYITFFLILFNSHIFNSYDSQNYAIKKEEYLIYHIFHFSLYSIAVEYMKMHFQHKKDDKIFENIQNAFISFHSKIFSWIFYRNYLHEFMTVNIYIFLCISRWFPFFNQPFTENYLYYLKYYV